MIKINALAPSRAALLLLIIGGALALSGCDKQPSSATAPTSSTPQASATGDASSQDAKQREDELARREAAVAERERAVQLAQREADAAAAEQELAKRKEADAAAAKVAARKAAAAKAAAAKAAAARVAAKSTSAGGVYPTSPPVPVARPVQVPGGTPIVVALSSPLSSKTAKIGDTFGATVASNVLANGRIAVPAGTRVSGKVVQVISGSRSIGAVPALGLEFDQLELDDGQVIPITGTLNEQGASEKVQDSAKIVGGAAAGAVIGHQVHTNSGGTIVGGLLGGAIGALVARNTGSEVQLAAGSQLTLNTAEPFTVVVRSE